MHNSDIPDPYMSSGGELASPAQSDLVVAISTIHRSIFTRLEWHLGSYAALGTYRRKHFALRFVAIAIIPMVVVTVAILPRFSCLTA